MRRVALGRYQRGDLSESTRATSRNKPPLIRGNRCAGRKRRTAFRVGRHGRRGDQEWWWAVDGVAVLRRGGYGTCHGRQAVYNNRYWLHIQVMHVGPYAP